MELRGGKVTVVGLGNSGINACMLLNDIGSSVRATDSGDSPSLRKSAMLLKKKGIDAEVGGHTEGFIRGSSLVVLSPGVEDASPAVKWAEKSRIPIISEMELGYIFCKGRIIGITGTNGKSTVTTLIGEILKSGGKDTVVCGNVGNSLCGEIVRIRPDTWVVLEVSSFQLERIEKFKPYIAVILNITDDHMDRYKNFNKYFTEKLKIFKNQGKGDILILNHDAVNLRGLKGKAKSETLFYSSKTKTNGAYIKDGKICCKYMGEEREIASVADVKLKGLYNLENVLACCLVGALAGVKDSSVRDALKNFKGLSHRCETVGTIDDVEYIDDSKGTTVDSTLRALESCDKSVVLIAGGKDKHSDYSLVRDMVKKRVSHIVLIGEAKEAIKDALKNTVPIHDAGDMRDAVKIAGSLVKPGSMVLLSPMCSSFDMFKDYKERGKAFKEAVESIKNRSSVKV